MKKLFLLLVLISITQLNIVLANGDNIETIRMEEIRECNKEVRSLNLAPEVGINKSQSIITVIFPSMELCTISILDESESIIYEMPFFADGSKSAYHISAMVSGGIYTIHIRTENKTYEGIFYI